MYVKSIITVILLTTVSACTWSDQIVYQEGASINDYRSELLQCKIDALNKIPQNIVIEKTPIKEVPEKETCIEKKSENGLETIKECTKTGGGTIGGEEKAVDINLDLRNDYINSCINIKGYQKITLPVCKKEQVQGVSRLNEYTPLQQVTKNSCIITNDTETGWIINP